MYKRQGGYVTIAKLGKRQGDDAEMTRLTWVEQFTALVPPSKKVVASPAEKQTKSTESDDTVEITEPVKKAAKAKK